MRARHAVLVAALTLVASGVSAFDCQAGPPPSLSSTYWDYLQVCGCAGAAAPSSVSLDFDRWLEVCGPWLQEAERQRLKARAIEEEKARLRPHEHARPSEESAGDANARTKEPEPAVESESEADSEGDHAETRNPKAKVGGDDESARERVDE
jgi:hypothetical protein